MLLLLLLLLLLALIAAIFLSRVENMIMSDGGIRIHSIANSKEN